MSNPIHAMVTVRMALKALTSNRLQALLALSGMSVGVAMVVIVSGLGRGAQLNIERQIESAGPTQIAIRAGNYRPAGITAAGDQDTSGGEQAEGQISGDQFEYGLDESVIDTTVQQRRNRAPRQTNYRTPATALGAPELQLLRQLPDVRAVSASVAGNITLDRTTGQSVRIARLNGFDAQWPEVSAWKLSSGRMISVAEHRDAAPVMLVNDRVAARLWPDASPLNQVMHIGGQAVKVVGTLFDDGQDAASVVPSVYVPLTLAQSLLGRQTVDLITVRTRSVGVTSKVAAQIKEQFRELHALPEDTLDDFRIETQGVAAMPSMGMDPRLARAVHANMSELDQASWEEMAKSLRQAGRTFTLLLAAAAGVSLLVGGIGVMNIMLVSVAARTREIGLRMAVGARMQDVMSQFIVESITLAAAGGVAGMVLGAIGLIIARHSLHWATAISPVMLVLAVAVAALTGVVFGYGPARRAAVLDPVVALKAD